MHRLRRAERRAELLPGALRVREGVALRQEAERLAPIERVRDVVGDQRGALPLARCGEHVHHQGRRGGHPPAIGQRQARDRHRVGGRGLACRVDRHVEVPQQRRGIAAGGPRRDPRRRLHQRQQVVAAAGEPVVPRQVRAHVRRCRRPVGGAGRLARHGIVEHRGQPRLEAGAGALPLRQQRLRPRAQEPPELLVIEPEHRDALPHVAGHVVAGALQPPLDVVLIERDAADRRRERGPQLPGQATPLGTGEGAEDRRRLELLRRREALEVERERLTHLGGEAAEVGGGKHVGAAGEHPRGDRRDQERPPGAAAHRPRHLPGVLPLRRGAVRRALRCPQAPLHVGGDVGGLEVLGAAHVEQFELATQAAHQPAGAPLRPQPDDQPQPGRALQ